MKLSLPVIFGIILILGTLTAFLVYRLWFPAVALKEAEEGTLAAVDWKVYAYTNLLRNKVLSRIGQLEPDQEEARKNLIITLCELRARQVSRQIDTVLSSKIRNTLVEPDREVIEVVTDAYTQTRDPFLRDRILGGTYPLDFNTRAEVLKRLFGPAEGENRLAVIHQLQSLWQIATTLSPEQEDTTWQDFTTDERQTTQSQMRESLMAWLPSLLRDALSPLAPTDDPAWASPVRWLLGEIEESGSSLDS